MMKLIKKIKNYKEVLIVALIGAMSMLQMTSALADPQSGITAAKDNVINEIKPIVNNAVVPVIALLLASGLLFAITHAVYNYRKGRDIELGWIIALVIGLILVITFPTWGWQLIS